MRALRVADDLVARGGRRKCPWVIEIFLRAKRLKLDRFVVEEEHREFRPLGARHRAAGSRPAVRVEVEEPVGREPGKQRFAFGTRLGVEKAKGFGRDFYHQFPSAWDLELHKPSWTLRSQVLPHCRSKMKAMPARGLTFWKYFLALAAHIQPAPVQHFLHFAILLPSPRHGDVVTLAFQLLDDALLVAQSSARTWSRSA